MDEGEFSIDDLIDRLANEQDEPLLRKQSDERNIVVPQVVDSLLSKVEANSSCNSSAVDEAEKLVHVPENVAKLADNLISTEKDKSMAEDVLIEFIGNASVGKLLPEVDEEVQVMAEVEHDLHHEQRSGLDENDFSEQKPDDHMENLLNEEKFQFNVVRVNSSDQVESEDPTDAQLAASTCFSDIDTSYDGASEKSFSSNCGKNALLSPNEEPVESNSDFSDQSGRPYSDSDDFSDESPRSMGSNSFSSRSSFYTDDKNEARLDPIPERNSSILAQEAKKGNGKYSLFSAFNKKMTILSKKVNEASVQVRHNVNEAAVAASTTAKRNYDAVADAAKQVSMDANKNIETLLSDTERSRSNSVDTDTSCLPSTTDQPLAEDKSDLSIPKLDSALPKPVEEPVVSVSIQKVPEKSQNPVGGFFNGFRIRGFSATKTKSNSLQLEKNSNTSNDSVVLSTPKSSTIDETIPSNDSLDANDIASNDLPTNDLKKQDSVSETKNSVHDTVSNESKKQSKFTLMKGFNMVKATANTCTAAVQTKAQEASTSSYFKKGLFGRKK